MAYAALVSLENTIHRFLNSDLFSISVEEEQQITSLREYVTPIRDFLEVFPDESKSWDEQTRELANAAEDILEYLVLEKVFLPCDNEFESYYTGEYKLELENAINETCLKLDEVREEFPKDSSDEAKANRLKDRIRDITNEVGDIRKLYKFQSKLQFIHHLNKRRDEIDSIMEEVKAIKNDSNAATSSSTLAPVDDILPPSHSKWSISNSARDFM